MDKASEAILALQRVTFRYRPELHPAGIPQFGLVAEQVEKVNPDLVARDDQGKPYTESNSYTHAYRDPNCDSHGDLHAYSYSNSHSHSDGNADSYSHTDAHSYSYSYTNCDGDGNSNANGDAYNYAQTDAHAEIRADGEASTLEAQETRLWQLFRPLRRDG